MAGHRGDVHLVAGLDHGLLVGQQPAAEPDHERRPPTGGGFQVGYPAARPVFVQRQLRHTDIARRIAPLGGLGLPGQHVEQPVGGPRHGGHGRNAQPFVDLGALGVVDAGDHALDAERFAGHSCRDDVRVVPRRHRGEGRGLLDTGPQQHVAVETHAQHTLTGKLGAEPVERRAITVDDGHIVADAGQAVG
jgi:hypothetical protein